MVDLIGRLSNPSPDGETDADMIEGSPDRVLTPRQTQRRLTSDDEAGLVDRRWAGETIEGLAERLGIHRTIVMAHLRRHGVFLRPRPGWG